MKFATRVFTWAGIFGLIVMTPMYFLEPQMIAMGQPLSHPEIYYGFVGETLVFQLIFLLIGRAPARYRPLMLAGVLEKLSFGGAVWPLYLMGRTPVTPLVFGTIDLGLGVLFLISWFRTRGAARPAQR